MRKIFLILILFSITCLGQSKDPKVIIKNLKDAFNKVKDYTVNVDVKVDVNFIKVPEMNAKIYFKQPDKVHIESKGFAMLPKDGMYTSPLSFLKNEYTPLYVKDEVIDNHNTSVIKIIPLNDKGNLILTTLWVDQSKEVIRKVESTTKTNGTFSLYLHYEDNFKYPLPDSMVFSFNSGEINSRFDPDEAGGAGRKRKIPKVIEGKVFIRYSSYAVNKGIPDSIFEKAKEKSKK